MTTPAREELVDWARGTIAAGSKSFGLASRLLRRRERENAWLLYAWCRACDDITDGQQLGYIQVPQAAEPVDLWQQTRLALRCDKSLPKAFAALREVHRDAGLPVRYIEDHLRGFDLDRAGWRPQTLEDLTLYCYHVAGAVGCLMARIMSVPPQDEDTLSRASDLGIAFQLNNIARDLVEDAGQGRCYIPADWLSVTGLPAAELALPQHRRTLASFAQALNLLARRYYASARIGAARLPWRSRLAVLSASNIYGRIGELVAQRGPAAWDRRSSTDALDKLLAIGGALRQSARPAPYAARAGLFDRESTSGCAKPHVL